MANSDDGRCHHPGCLNFIDTWCHASCCSGETGLCRTHWEGSRHQREFFYEQMMGALLPQSAEDCALALGRQRVAVAEAQAAVKAAEAAAAGLAGLAASRAAARLDRFNRTLADAQLVERLLLTELEALSVPRTAVV